MNQPPKSKPIRIVEVMRQSGKYRKGDIMGDYGQEGTWLLKVTGKELLPSELVTSQDFAIVCRAAMEVSKLHLFGQKMYKV